MGIQRSHAHNQYETTCKQARPRTSLRSHKGIIRVTVIAEHVLRQCHAGQAGARPSHKVAVELEEVPRDATAQTRIATVRHMRSQGTHIHSTGLQIPHKKSYPPVEEAGGAITCQWAK